MWFPAASADDMLFSCKERESEILVKLPFVEKGVHLEP